MTGVTQFGAEYGSGTSVIGFYTDAAKSSGLYFNSTFWGGNQYVTTMKISEIAHSVGPLLFMAGTANDINGYFHGVISGEKLGINTTFGIAGVIGGPIGGAGAGAYFFLDTIDSTTAGHNYFSNQTQTIIHNQEISPYSDNFPVLAPY